MLRRDILTACFALGAILPQAEHATTTEYRLKFLYSLGETGQGVLFNPSDVEAADDHVYVVDRFNPADGENEGRVYEFSGPNGRLIAKLPAPRELALDVGTKSLLVVADNYYSIYRVSIPDGRVTKLVSLDRTTDIAGSIAVGGDGTMFVNSRQSRKHFGGSIAVFGPDGSFKRGFGEWVEADRRPAVFQLNTQQLIWRDGQLCAAAVLASLIRCYGHDSTTRQAFVETRPFTAGPQPVQPRGPTGITFRPVLTDICAFGPTRLLALVWTNAQSPVKDHDRLLGIVVGGDLSKAAEVYPAAGTPADRLDQYVRIAAIGPDEYALVALFRKRVDIFQLETLGKRASK